MIADQFQDLYEGAPKILFIGLPQSSHTHGWINLLSESRFNVRLFGVPGGVPPRDWWVPSYVSRCAPWKLRSSTHVHYLYKGVSGVTRYCFERVIKRLSKSAAFPVSAIAPFHAERLFESALLELIERWRPDIVHTLGVFDGQGGELFYRLRERYPVLREPIWVAQVRGGSDVVSRMETGSTAPLTQILLASDQILTDNVANIELFKRQGISAQKIASVCPVPGSGGLELDDASSRMPASKRERLILYPRAYESRWSSSAPVIEALRLAWSRIKPCKIVMTAIDATTKGHIAKLPHEIRSSLELHSRLPRTQLLELFSRARVALLPSKVDGVPNALYESMAHGAFPIVSPLETIATVVKEQHNVLYANNCDHQALADALAIAMQNDLLVDQATLGNFQLVSRIANRKTIKTDIVAFYQRLSASKRGKP